MKRITFELTDEDHKKIKLKCVKENITIKEFIYKEIKKVLGLE